MIGAALDVEPKPPAPLEFDEFYTSERRRLFASVVLLTKDGQAADDLVQDTFVRVLERWDRVSAMESPLAYLYRIAFNLHRSRARRHALRARHAPENRVTSDVADEAANRVAVWRALGSLTAEQREAMVLIDLAAFTSEEAGDVLGIDAAAVRARVHRARERMREELSDDG